MRQRIARKLANVVEQIADTERRIAEQQERLQRGGAEAGEAETLLYLATNTLQEMRAYKASLERLIAPKPSRDQSPH